MKRMKIEKSRFYQIKNRVQSAIEKDYRRAKVQNPKLKPMDYEWEEAEMQKIVVPANEYSLPYLQTKYIEKFGTVPNRYKNDKDWIASKLSCFSTVNETQTK